MKFVENKLKLIKLILLVIFFFLFAGQDSNGQSDKKFIEITPGAQFQSGWFKELFFGSHWRDVWAVPVKVEVLNLNEFAKGLTPIEKGGGLQTKSLRFKGGDGNFWKFRSIEKDPSKALPPQLNKTIAADILKDQISSAHPFAALVAAPILDSLKVIHNEPYLYFMPDDKKLGEFRNEFGGIVGMIEIHPDVEEEEGVIYRNADKVKSTLKLFDQLAENLDETVNASEFLKARLIDLFIGDWDRHTDQWKWALYSIEGKKTWLPIPRDRDQPFAKFDGLFVRIAEYMIPQFVHFDSTYPQIEDITWSGRFIDRRFLTELDKPQWDSVTAFVKSKLTDDLIETSVMKLPPGVYELSKDELESKLKMRRDNIVHASNEYYELINNVVDIYGSELKDYFSINRIDDNFTVVNLFSKDKNSQAPKGKIRYSKKFNNKLTSEIRIHMLGDDDFAIIEGKVDCSPLIRIIGGDGADEVIDNSIVNGYWLDITPISDAENKTVFYDSGKKSKVELGPGTCFDDQKVKIPKDESEKYEPQLRDRGNDWFPVPVINLNSDDGFIIGGGPSFTKYNFRADPFDYYLSLTAHYATIVKSGAINFKAVFNSWLPNAAVLFNAEYTGLKFTKYFGFGNQTNFNYDLEESNYYRVRNTYFKLNSQVLLGTKKNNQFSIGLTYGFSDLSVDNQELLVNNPSTDFGLGRMQSLELNAIYSFDTRDNADNPYEGFLIKTDFTFAPEALDIKSNLFSVEFDARKYFTFNIFSKITLALRGGGKKVWGGFPFLSAAFLGGKENLRGYSRERFAGNAFLFGQSELRIILSEVKLLLPGYLGLSGFAESGRVFADHESSDQWHPSYGGGIWIDYLDRLVTISINIADSKEKTSVYFQLGMMF